MNTKRKAALTALLAVLLTITGVEIAAVFRPR